MTKETIYSIMKWHEETFPDATLDGQVSKALEEAGEFIEIKDLKDFNKGVEELADVFIVGCGLARFSVDHALNTFDFVSNACRNATKFSNEDFAHYLTQLARAVDKKMEINRQRKWTKGKGEYKHVEE